MVNFIKHPTIVIYESRVVLTRKLPISYDSRVIIYNRKNVYKTTEVTLSF